ncbi:hypothetical protein AGMMS49975_14510 [Clostridia bacterium]|nr:hypothetical protein AGMMS49975_14510 [Clostridia bacterium]
MCLDYDLSSHPELCADLTKFASALLPHERGDSGSFHILLDIVTRMIRTQEMEAEYFLFFSVAEKLEQVSFLTKSKPVFLRDVFDTILNANLYEVIQKDGQGFAVMMAEEGKTSDFLIEQNVQEAASLVKESRIWGRQQLP